MKKIGIILVMMLLMITSVLAVAPTVETLDVHWVGYDSATLKGNVTSLAALDNSTAYFKYTETDDISWVTSTQTQFVNETGEYTLNVFDLTQGVNYTYVAFILDGENEVEALNNITFVTNTSPLISTLTTTEIGADTFTLNANLTSLGDEDNVTVYFECYYGDDSYLNTSDDGEFMNETGTVSITITDATPDTSYICFPTIEWDFGGEDAYTYGSSDSFDTLDDTTEIETGILGVQSLTFAAFGLLAVMLLAAVAMLLITTMSKGTDVTQMMTMGVYLIGGAIVIFVGYLIIASVANGLI